MSYASVRRRRAARAKRGPYIKGNPFDGRYAIIEHDPMNPILDGALVRIQYVYENECDPEDYSCENGECAHIGNPDDTEAIVAIKAPPKGIKAKDWEYASVIGKTTIISVKRLRFRKNDATLRAERANVIALLDEVGF